MAALPIHATTGGTTPECLMSRAHPVGDDLLHLLEGRGHEDFVTEGAAGQRIDESEGKNLRDLADLFLEIVGPNLDRAGDAARELLVPRQQNPFFQSNPLDEGAIRTRLRIGRVVTHEPEPTGETPEHVIAQQFHRTTVYSRRIPSPRRSLRSSRRVIESSTNETPIPTLRVLRFHGQLRVVHQDRSDTDQNRTGFGSEAVNPT